MFSRAWSTSQRRFDVTVDSDVAAATRDGTRLVGDVYRPSARGRFPVVLSISPYDRILQSPPMRPTGFHPMTAWMEAGDPVFFARRGYAHAIFNVRGTGDSGGFFQFGNGVEVGDVADLIEWLAEQPWCDGNVGTFGVSYFARLSRSVAAMDVPSLKAAFHPWSCNDWYRDVWYHGGICSGSFLSHWRFSAHNLRYESLVREELGDDAYRDALDALQQDPEIMGHPLLSEIAANPTPPRNQLVTDMLLKSLDGPFWRERDPETPGDIPAYFGADWGNYAIHLRGAFSAFEQWRGVKQLTIGPGVYLDRPVYQNQMEAVRWFDQFLLGQDTGVLDEPSVRVFIPPTGEWRGYDDWPPPEARWTCFFLHQDGLLSEHELWPNEGADTFNESRFEHGELTYTTPPLVEATELLGPSVLTLYVSTTAREALLFATLLLVNHDGQELELTRGWLRASQRHVAEDRSERWEPYLRHTERQPLTPGDVYELKIPIVATARLCRPGERIRLRIKGADDEPAATALENIARGHVTLPGAARITIHHDGAYASRLDLPITRGNLMGTYFSGGDISGFEFRKSERR